MAMAGTGLDAMSAARYAAALLIFVHFAAPAAAVGVRVAGEDRPCTLYVYSDGSWSGAVEVPVGAPVRPLLADAARSLLSSMEAWERRLSDQLLPALGSEEAPADSLAASEHGRVIRFLARELRATIQVDSMTAEISARPNGTDRESLAVRLWVARELDAAGGGKRREFDLYSMKSEWVYERDGWSLRRLWDFAATYWPPEQDARVATPFPARPPVWTQAGRDGSDRAGGKVAARWKNITWIEDGTMLPPYPVFGDVAPPTTAGGPVLVTKVEANYPEFAREALIEGTVVIEVLVGSDGRVASAKLVRGVTGLNDAALHAVRKWVFQPARDETGTPRTGWYEAVFEFHRR